MLPAVAQTRSMCTNKNVKTEPMAAMCMALPAIARLWFSDSSACGDHGIPMTLKCSFTRSNRFACVDQTWECRSSVGMTCGGRAGGLGRDAVVRR